MVNQSLRTYQWFLLAALLAAAVAIAVRFEVDFTVIYGAAALSRVDPSHIYGLPVGGATGGRFFYGPFSFFLIQPLALVSFPVAKWIWIGLQTLAYAVFWAFLFAHFEVLKKRQLAWLWVFVAAINPVHLNFQSNNIQLMLLAALMVAEILSKRKEWWWQGLAGGLVAAVSCIKLYPLFIAVYFWLVKKRMVRVGLVLGFITALCVPFLQFGIGKGLALYQGFLHSLASYHKDNSLIESFNIQCLPSLLARLLPRYIVEGRSFAAIVLAAVGSIAFAYYRFVYLHVDRARKDEKFETHLWSCALALMVFLNPSSFGHYLVFFIPAICSLIEILEVAENREWFPTLGLVVGTALMAFVVDGVLGKPLSNQLQRDCLPTVGLIAICLALSFCLVKGTAATRVKGWPR